jgi:phenylacetate-CoA ligase
MLKYYDKIREFEDKDLSEVRSYQHDRLKKMVQYARENMDYYADSLSDVDTDSEDLGDLLGQIPVLDKQQLRDNPQRFTNDDYADHKITTSGSTGTPLVMWANKAQLEKRLAMNLRNREWMGYQWGDKSVRLWHQKIGMSTIQWLKERFEAFLSREKFIPVFKMGDNNLGEIINEIDEYNPELVDGYAEAYNILVEYCKREGIKKDWSRVVSSGQQLHPSTRESIQDYLGAEVFDRYGAREFSGIAQERPAHDGKHNNS